MATMKTRTVKAPDERKQELLDTAMRLFVERGFSATSMRDIAKAADVTPGLAYHYFDSKQKLFAEALEAYAQQCAEEGVEVLDDATLAFDEKIKRLLSSIAREESMPYHEFFHKEGNRAFHDELSVRLCDILVPHIAAAIATEGRRLGKVAHMPQTQADFIAHGIINLISDPDTPDSDVLDHIEEYIHAIVDSQMKEREES